MSSIPALPKEIYECPFNWEMGDMLQLSKEDDKMHNELNMEHHREILVSLAMKFVTKLWENAMKQNFDIADNNIDIIKQIRGNIDETYLKTDYISIKVIDHVINSTMYYALNKMERIEDAQKVKPEQLNLNNEIEESTLLGCKSLAWGRYYEHGCEKALFYAQEAIKRNSKTSHWYYVAGMNLRSKRCKQNSRYPTELEKYYFYTAYILNSSHWYGLKLALCYKENNEPNKALAMYHEIKKSNVRNSSFYLGLALGFIHYKCIKDANECLDKAESLNANSSIYYHYRGLYFKKINNYNEAMYFFKKATETGNFKAAINYAECCLLMDPNENIIDYLEQLLTKFDSEYEQMSLWIYIGVQYYERKKDYKSTLKCFQEAFSINPKNKLLIDFYYPFSRIVIPGIYNFLETKLFPKVEEYLDTSDADILNAYQFLKSVTQKREVYDSLT